MDPGADAVFSDEPRPIPQKATVSWKTGDGMVHHQEVEVSGSVENPG
jgi:hypothetical protein